MSWSAGLTKTEQADLPAKLDELVPSPVSDSPDVTDQFEAAKTAAAAIIESGAVGEKPVNIGLSGHANPGHEPLDGYANDLVHVTVTQA